MPERVDWKALDARAWALCYHRPLAAKDIGHQLIASGGEAGAAGWVQVALIEVRLGQRDVAEDALRRACRATLAWPDALRSAFCDAISASALQQAGRTLATAQLQAKIEETELLHLKVRELALRGCGADGS